MAINRVIKTLNNLSKAFKIDIGGDFFRERTKDYGKKIQGRLLDGVLRGYDIEGKTFKGLKESTLNIRRTFKNNTGTSPLRESGRLLDFLNSPDLIESGEVQILLKEPTDEYMTLQNEGFSPTGGFLPGKTVPPRKWYGIPKTYREGGTQYELFLNKIIKEINNKITDAINES